MTGAFALQLQLLLITDETPAARTRRIQLDEETRAEQEAPHQQEPTPGLSWAGLSGLSSHICPAKFAQANV